MLPDIQPGNTKILYFFNCLLDGMHTKIAYICDFSRYEKSSSMKRSTLKVIDFDDFVFCTTESKSITFNVGLF